MIDPARLQTFADELRELCARHGLSIGGCGCCGSPFVTPVEEDRDFGAENLRAGPTAVTVELGEVERTVIRSPRDE